MTVEPRSTAVAIRAENSRSWPTVVLQGSVFVLERVGVWAADTAQQFGAMVAALMGPAVLSVYAFVAWSLAANLGWTDTFVFKPDHLSNWMIWMGIGGAGKFGCGYLAQAFPDGRAITLKQINFEKRHVLAGVPFFFVILKKQGNREQFNVTQFAFLRESVYALQPLSRGG